MLDFIITNSKIVGLLFFFIVFLGIAFWVLNPKNKQKIESYKNIPLSKD